MMTREIDADRAPTESTGKEERGSPRHFGDPAGEYRAACARAALFDLSDRGKVELSGPDAVTFLHNLCTNDIKGLPPGGGCEAFLTTAKARVVAQVFVSRLPRAGGDVLLLDTAAGGAERLLQHLNHFLISEQVEVADRTGDLALFHLCGPDAGTLLAAVLPPVRRDLDELHSQELSTSDGEAVRVRRHDLLGVPGYDLFLVAGAAAPLWDALQGAGAVPAGHQVFETLRVEAGLPLFGPDIDENRLVMEVGRTRQAICYTKGCYLGQEPIVMARDRGHVNRTLLGLRLPEGGPVAPGARIFHDGKEAGVVTSSVLSPRAGMVLALGYLQRGSQAQGTAVEVETPQGRRPAFVTSLPFREPIPGPA